VASTDRFFIGDDEGEVRSMKVVRYDHRRVKGAFMSIDPRPNAARQRLAIDHTFEADRSST
jgi:hypothetical protein